MFIAWYVSFLKYNISTKSWQKYFYSVRLIQGYYYSSSKQKKRNIITVPVEEVEQL